MAQRVHRQADAPRIMVLMGGTVVNSGKGFNPVSWLVDTWKLTRGSDEVELRRQILLAFLNGQSVRKTAKTFSVRERYVVEILIDALKAPKTVQDSVKARAPYERMGVRQTPTQRGLVFDGRECPVKITGLRIELNYEEASELIGWLNDEIDEEQPTKRRKALENLLDKVRREERRKDLEYRIRNPR